MNDHLSKLKILEENGESPFRLNKFTTDTSANLIFEKFSPFSKQQLETEKFKVRIAGRIMRFRNFGNLCFAVVRCSDGDLQLVVINDKEFSNLDLGDIIGAEGIVFRTDRGELSVKVTFYQLLSKCLKTIPDFHYRFNDVEERFRNRHLDLMINVENREVLVKRAKINSLIRKFLDERGFIEVETPVLVPEASGAQARPFVTHHYTLNRDFQLRIATEISLKKLIIGGFSKIYEIGKVFRNEGIDARHNPEFTTIEIYEAYQNSQAMMGLTEELIRFLCLSTSNSSIEFRDSKLDFARPFQKVKMLDLVKVYSGIDFSTVTSFAQAATIANSKGVHLEKHENSTGHVIAAFFSKFVEHELTQPTFVCDYPIEVSPLAKSIKGRENFADRFELFISGIEFANGYSELNDPFEQESRFEAQMKEKNLGNDEIASLDNDFVQAMHYGMPPTGGLGIGIDRLVMLLTGKNSIREVVTFPQMKKKQPTE